jgi:hypothetical protein
VGDTTPISADAGDKDVTTTGDTSTNDAPTSDVIVDAGPWTPAVLDQTGDLALWLDATESNVVISNNVIGQWTDLSKNHNDATNTQSGPTLDTNIVNGHDAVYFAVHGLTLGIADAPSLQFATDQFVIMAVARATTKGFYFFSKSHAKQNGSGSYFYTGFEFLGTSGTVDGGDGGLVLFPYAHFAEDTLDSGTSVDYPAGWNGSVFDDGKFHLVGVRRPNSGTLTLYVDDQTPQSTTTGGFDISQVGYGVRIGSVAYGNFAPPMNGEIAEIVVVHAKIIADATVTSLHDYLKAKYAL